MDQITEAPAEIETKSEVLDRDEIRAIWRDFLWFHESNPEVVDAIDAKIEMELKGESEEAIERAKLKVLLTAYGVLIADEMREEKMSRKKGNRAAKSKVKNGDFKVADSGVEGMVVVHPDGEMEFNKRYLIEASGGWFLNLFDDEPKSRPKGVELNQIEILQQILVGFEEYRHPYDLGLYADRGDEIWEEADLVREKAEQILDDAEFLKTYYSSELEYLGLLAQQKYLRKWLPSSIGRVNKFVRDVDEVRRKRNEEEAILANSR